MFNLGIGEMAFIALLALLLIGPKQLPEVARTLGRFLNDLKRTTNGLKDEFQNQIRFDQEEIRRKIMEAPDRTKRSASVQDKVPQPPAIEENVFTGDPNLPHPPMDSASGHLTDYNHQQSKPVSENLMNQSEENSSNKSQGNTDQTSHVSTPGTKGPVK